MPASPDPSNELRIVALNVLPGANYWTRRPVTRLDLAIGAFDTISSADVEGFAERIVDALPGLRDHRCSIGAPGGFVERLRRGTYAAHIVEHVALEIQAAIGHRVGYGRARGSGREGEYTIVFEHLHGGVGQRSATIAVDLVRAAFARDELKISPALTELREIARAPDSHPHPHQHVACGLIGGCSARTLSRRIAGAAGMDDRDVVRVSPRSLLESGLPYASSDLAVVHDVSPDPELPWRYRDPDRIRRLYLTVAEVLPSGGWLVIPDADQELERSAQGIGVNVARFRACPTPASDGSASVPAPVRPSARALPYWTDDSETRLTGLVTKLLKRRAR